MNRQHRYVGTAAVALGLMAWSGMVLAGDQRIGDWQWNVDDPEMFVAGTENAAGHALAQFCDPSEGSCIYIVGFDIHCEPGNKYPVLVNSDAGSAQMEFVCGDRAGDQNVLVATDFESMDNIVGDCAAAGNTEIFAVVNEPIDMQPVVCDGPRRQLPGVKMLLELVKIPHEIPPAD